MIQPSSKDVAKRVRDGAAIDHAIERAGYAVVRRHRQLGVPVVLWRDGRVVEVAPETIELPEDDRSGAHQPL